MKLYQLQRLYSIEWRTEMIMTGEEVWFWKVTAEGYVSTHSPDMHLDRTRKSEENHEEFQSR
jgi:hypothetical protein